MTEQLKVSSVPPEVLDRLEGLLNHASMGPKMREEWNTEIAHWYADLAGTIRRQSAHIEALEKKLVECEEKIVDLGYQVMDAMRMP